MNNLNTIGPITTYILICLSVHIIMRRKKMYKQILFSTFDLLKQCVKIVYIFCISLIMYDVI